MRALKLAMRRGLVSLRRNYYARVYGMDIADSAWFSLKAHFDFTPAGLWPIPNDMIANLHGCGALQRIAVRFRMADLFFVWMELR